VAPEISFAPEETVVQAVQFGSDLQIRLRSNTSAPFDLRIEQPCSLRSKGGEIRVDLGERTGLVELLEALLYAEVAAVHMFTQGAIELHLRDGTSLRCEGGDEYEAWELTRHDPWALYVGGTSRQLHVFDRPAIRIDPGRVPALNEAIRSGTMPRVARDE
jgi:hypothetical protein